jgi:hypothetical protein
MKREVLSACAVALGAIGFTSRRTRGIFVRPEAPEVFGWVGLGLAGGHGVLSVAPTVGVRNDAFATLVAELAPDLTTPDAATVATNVGHLSPENMFRSWEFREGGDHAKLADRMVRDIDEYGTPMMKGLADEVALYDAMEAGRFVLPHQRARLLPIVKALRGDLPAAVEIIEAELRTIEGVPGAYTEEYLDFAQRFRERFVQ